MRDWEGSERSRVGEANLRHTRTSETEAAATSGGCGEEGVNYGSPAAQVRRTSGGIGRGGLRVKKLGFRGPHSGSESAGVLSSAAARAGQKGRIAPGDRRGVQQEARARWAGGRAGG